ncbi:MAG: hypothetical protein CVU18_00325 [Betaproteobacteria bacterium HGW-Betaproteobacteria-12]|nr:MAG: hypothetical protein CVU18_00325 [Betaproteobacteria bacterium HGW-Betaproteobacteria-12]
MTPCEIRQLKRSIRKSIVAEATEDDRYQARTSAIALLEHSVQRRHKRLAVIRFAAAIRTGATIRLANWKYCEEALASVGDDKLRQLVIDAIDGVTENPAIGL